MAKKTKLPPKAPSNAGIQAGHRDLAEILSTDYILTTNRIGWPQQDSLTEMSTFTNILEQIDGNKLLAVMHDRWAQGFLMGQLHQACIERDNREAEDAEVDDFYEDE